MSDVIEEILEVIIAVVLVCVIYLGIPLVFHIATLFGV